MEKRQKNVAGRMWWLAGAFLLLSCRPAYQLTEVEGGRVAMTETFDRVPQDGAAVAIVQSYKAKVDSVMSPVIGRSKMEMDVAVELVPWGYGGSITVDQEDEYK